MSLARIWHGPASGPTAPLINTPLQRGERGPLRLETASAVSAGVGETAEAVLQIGRPSITPLKQGVPPRTAGWATLPVPSRSADFQSAVSRVSNLLKLEPATTSCFESNALPIGNRRYRRLEICATKQCRQSNGLRCNERPGSESAELGKP